MNLAQLANAPSKGIKGIVNRPTFSKAINARKAPARNAFGTVRAHSNPAPKADRREFLAGSASLIVLRSTSASAAEFETGSNGLKYSEEVVGEGPSPVKGAKIQAHYTGRLTDGTVFDSSYPRGKPLAFPVGVGVVIKGWDQGILGGEGIPPMKEGGKRKLIIPPELGYGARGAGRGLIPPNATLEFDVELVKAK